MPISAEWMRLALKEAERGRGRTTPNPIVGCVIVRGSRLVAAGHHKRAGGPHAEIEAMRKAGIRARGSDVYVTLEPCAHQGRTGPCTEALIAAGVRRVYAGMRDPNPLVAGRGSRRLRSAGIAVEVGVLRAECEQMNAAYLCRLKNERPLFVAKIAQSIDGRVATRTGDSKWITGPAARRRGHAMRNTHDAIMVGVGTVAADDAQLTCRTRGGRDPVRIVLDPNARTPPTARVVKGALRSRAPTWVVVGTEASVRKCRALERAGATVLRCRTRKGRIDLRALGRLLYERDLSSVLVEGGPTVIGAMHDAQLIDRVCVFVAPKLLGGDGAISSVGGKGVGLASAATELEEVRVEHVGPICS